MKNNILVFIPYYVNIEDEYSRLYFESFFKIHVELHKLFFDSLDNFIVYSNYEFKYKDVSTTLVNLGYSENLYFNKFLYIEQFLKTISDDDIVWLRDLDLIQVNSLHEDDLTFNNDIYTIMTEREIIGDSSMFLRKSSLDLFSSFIEYFMFREQSREGQRRSGKNCAIVFNKFIKRENHLDQFDFSMGWEYNLKPSSLTSKIERYRKCQSSTIKAVHLHNIELAFSVFVKNKNENIDILSPEILDLLQIYLWSLMNESNLS